MSDKLAALKEAKERLQTTIALDLPIKSKIDAMGKATLAMVEHNEEIITSINDNLSRMREIVEKIRKHVKNNE